MGSDGCNVDDILCQLRLLDNLKSLRENMGDASFIIKFPELTGLEPKLTREIENANKALRVKIEECGNLNTDEMPEEFQDELEEIQAE